MKQRNSQIAKVINSVHWCIIRNFTEPNNVNGHLLLHCPSLKD